ncbi:Gfo/Idh/MocA family oxidoreductase [Panacibacter ginsenosidivorans]|uniref:Gfo/Idh/MocA family oxidoreductase n=1 Tax=Panacibacter ginsenosidivorans TaxID=1813871 RepID=A0A5B8V6D9_9BACT|nr:Gfo/Idh/MocA family oxidoreductase [Panacibacter ginsenosidivorans]QEC66685.1 Gfo/Idh/MocA family oxidoreductase [Panacibacter ginsenosidivorans]
MHKKIGFAILGLGELTETQLLPAFEKCRYAEPVALVSDDTYKANELAEKYNLRKSCVYSYDNFDEIGKNPAVDVVYIVLPNVMHKDFTIRSAKAGKHVLCEKPMATNISDAKMMIDACKNANRKLMIAYRIQHEPHNRVIKEWIDNDVFGRVKVIECFNGEYIDDASQWRFKQSLAGGGALMDLGIYCINTIRFLTGNEPVWVAANMYSTPGDKRFKEVEETILFQMGFEDGIIASCAASYSLNYQRYRCFTNNTWFGMDPAFAYSDLKIEVSKTNDGKDSPLPVVKQENQFVLVMDHMAECILNDKSLATPGEEGLKDQYVIAAIYKSAKQKKVIFLNEITEDN